MNYQKIIIIPNHYRFLDFVIEFRAIIYQLSLTCAYTDKLAQHNLSSTVDNV